MSCFDLLGVCVQNFIKHANFLAQHLGAMPLRQATFHVFMIIFLKFWNLKAMVLNVCVQAVTPICLKIPSILLHMELTCTQGHKYDFAPHDGLQLHVHAVQI